MAETTATGDSGDRWALRATDRALLGNKSGATRLGFAVLLKLFDVAPVPILLAKSGEVWREGGPSLSGA